LKEEEEKEEEKVTFMMPYFWVLRSIYFRRIFIDEKIQNLSLPF